MQWYTTYLIMRPRQPSAPLTLAATRAGDLAAAWLAPQQPGATTAPPDTCSGYYTLHILKDGQVTDTLSVHGYTGQIWDHTWPGAFIQMQVVTP